MCYEPNELFNADEPEYIGERGERGGEDGDGEDCAKVSRHVCSVRWRR